ncbi:GntR family transcriptional regulator [Eubacterium multiforme]|uniref:GntR family transcriptional regulator n=1 Tax=Eubacterium multiforme TaxID=83339 RepID=A0ABT9UY75_9FIRM|nr:GntR family transcriptional regulator [Eubacterium multiforme]MDQ0151276.1 GntR family transcriptional regulator [Eubacterium multiforme]
MKILISNNSDKPLYIQIKEQIKDAIFSNQIDDGALLPSIRNFANELKVSVLTIRRVYDELESEGFVTIQAGKGTFVSCGNIELLLEYKRHIVEQKIQETIDSAKLLGIDKAELIEMINILYEEEI